MGLPVPFGSLVYSYSRSIRDAKKLTDVDAQDIAGASLLSSVSMPRFAISESVKPVIFELEMLRVAPPVALNQPGNFIIAPFLIAKLLPAPETVTASFTYGSIAFLTVVRVALSSTSAPPALTLSD